MNPFTQICHERGEFENWKLGDIIRHRGGMKFLRALKKEYDISPPKEQQRKELHECLLDMSEMLEN